MSMDYFHPSVRTWFEARFGAATDVQLRSWPVIQQDPYTLIAAPTGSGKTLAAFLVAIDDLIKQHISGKLLQQTQVLYVSPLKALTNDIERNLREPLEGITRELEMLGYGNPRIKVSVRTGDTTSSERASMVRVPPHIIVTTPESLYLLLTSDSGRKMLAEVKTVIIDEIHAMADDKRGAHLALSLERLEAMVSAPLKRIGLSATQKPIGLVADFLTGNRPGSNCRIINNLQTRKYDIGLVLPDSPLSPVMSNEVWTEIHQKLVHLIQEHKTTLIFVNTRRLAERLTHSLDPFLEKNTITAHHGSMSKKHRESAEQRLKHGHLKALVATASLELGIDIGSVDLVVQISSPRSISAFIQRLGRSRHYVNGVPKGRLIPLTLNDLIECTALLYSVRKGELDTLHIPEKPVDVLAQQIVAEVSCAEYKIEELYTIFTKAYPFRNLTLDEFTEVSETLSRGYSTRKGRNGAYVHLDKINNTIKPRRAARLTALINGGTIPDSFDFDVVLEPENTLVGTVNEDFATESLPGDVFQLGNSSWKIKKIESGKIRVEDAHGQPPDMPFWLGEAPGRTRELSLAVSDIIQDMSESISANENIEEEIERIKKVYKLEQIAAEQLIKYLSYTQAAFGALPSEDIVILERFFDQAGDTHIVLHSVFGTRVNRAWGLALRKRFCRKFNFELQAAANENGIVLSLGPTHSFPLEEVFSYLSPVSVREILIQALLDSPIFGVRWRWNASTALAITRRNGGKRVAPQLQRMQAEDLISLIFPDQLACPENLEGDREVPDHPLVNQTIYDCLHEAMDIDMLEEILTKIQKKEIKTIAVDLREPSPMAQEVLVAQPYAFLDNAPLEERRVHAVYSRRWSGVEEASSMAQLDPAAIQKVKDEVWPRVRNADELYDALMVGGFFTDKEVALKEDFNNQYDFLTELIAANRAAEIEIPGTDYSYWIAIERIPEFMRTFPESSMKQQIPIPEEVLRESAKVENPLLELVRSRLDISGPVTLQELRQILPVKHSELEQVLITLETEGFAFRGKFSSSEEEWCERRFLARIHRYTIDKLRSEIKPVSQSEFMQYLFHWQHILSDDETTVYQKLRKVLDQLEGYEAQSVAWEGDILQSRVKTYSYTALDLLLMTGEYIWGRFKSGKPDPQQLSNVPIRTTPVTFIKRENLKYYQSQVDSSLIENISLNARRVFNLLQDSGALFFFQLEEKTRLFKSQVEDALTELISVGLVTSDSFTGLRTLLIPDKYYTDRRKAGKIVFNLQQAGRWWLLNTQEIIIPEHQQEEYLESLAMMLLNRYGVVFRKLAEKEKLLFAWYDLLKIYRRMEARGIIRGGRFVEGFGGEQYALPEAVSSLRSLRRQESSESLVSISAADPLNLTGFITPGKRVPAFYGNRILYKNGSPIAYKEGKEVEFIGDIDQETQWNLKKVLLHRDVQPELRPYLVF